MSLEVFLPHITEFENEIKQGTPITIEITDNSIYEAKVVKAIVAKTEEELPDGEELFLKDSKDDLLPYQWRIKVLEEIDTPFPRIIRPKRGIE